MVGQTNVILLYILDTQSQVTSAYRDGEAGQIKEHLSRGLRTNIEKHFTGELMLDRPLVSSHSHHLNTLVRKNFYFPKRHTLTLYVVDFFLQK